ncbi:MAG TPA: transposase [Candidatus Binatia bacterium]|nr:transposase [Candidatus Binatia bacterium]
MSRKPRVHFPGAVYHVISRGNQKQTIFEDREDFLRFRNFLEDAQRRFAFRLYAYVLMPNHFHLLLEVRSHPLFKVMQALLYRYSRYFNDRHRKVGHLFQGRYRAILCDKDSYLLELVRYLHLNPVRAGLAADASQYPWSSHAIFLKGRDQSGLAVETVLSYLSKRRGDAVRKYGEFVSEGAGQGHRDDFYEVKEQRYLGDDEFIAQVEKEREKVEDTRTVRLTIDDAVEETLRHFAATIEKPLDKERGHEASHLRAIAAYVGREVGSIKLSEMASYFKRDLSTLSFRIKKLEERMREEPGLKQQINQMCETLRMGRKRKYQITKA